MRNYTVDVTRDGDSWMVDMPGIRRAARTSSLKEAESLADSLTTFVTGEPAGSFHIDVRVNLPDEVKAHVHEAKRQRGLADEAARRAAAESRLAASTLHGMGVTLRDIGTLLGVSYQRAHQLVNS